MRIRKATIAGATALAVAFGGTTVASAAEGSSNDSTSNSSASAGEQQGNQKAGGSSALGKALEADKEANARTSSARSLLSPVSRSGHRPWPASVSSPPSSPSPVVWLARH